MKQKIVIDTNIIYSWAELSTNEKLDSKEIEELSKRNELYITTTSLLEIIVKYRNDLKSIKKCLDFIFKDKLKIISIGFTPVTNEQLEILYNQTDKATIEKTIEDLFKLKVQKETEFLRFFLVSLITGIINALIEKSELPKNSNNYKNLILHSKALLEGNLQFLYNAILSTLLEGYKNNNIKQAIKNIFSVQAYSFFYLWKTNYYIVVNNLSLPDYQKAEQIIKEKISISLKEDKFLKKLKNNYDNPLSLFSKKEYKKSVLDYLNGLQNHLRNDGRFTKETIEYTFEKFTKYLTEKKKIDKNDVLDLLIVYSLYLKDYLILTLDNDFIKFLKNYHTESYDFVNRTLK